MKNYIHKMIRCISNMINDLYNRSIIKRKKIEINGFVSINGRIGYFGIKNRLSIGNGTRINSGDSYIPIGYPGKCVFWIMDSGIITIGRNCGLSNVTICSRDKVTIGNNVIMGGGVKIYDTDFHSLNYIKRRDLDNDNDRASKSILIGDDVFIGAGVIILKGTRIGERSIIGAGSVVSGDIPCDEIWAGNPARCIKKQNN